MTEALPLLTLERFAYSPRGSFGRLTGEGLDLFTVERPWAGNARKLSCIPEGLYTCRRVMSPRFGDTFEVTDVPGRSHILFHPANTMDELEGCIAPGLSLGCLDGQWSVVSSRAAMSAFFRALGPRRAFELRIVPYQVQYP